MTKRIALTGATGFVGGHLLNELVSCGYNVNALTRRSQPQRANVTWIQGDFKNAAALRTLVNECDVIINVAGLIKARSMDNFMDANAYAVSALLDACKNEKNAPHFIQISTLTAREPHLSDYANSKNEGEKILIKNAANCAWTIIRPPAIYGPADTETLKIFKALNFRLALYADNSENRVSWLHVADLVAAICAVMGESSYFDKTFEIDDGVPNGYSHEEFYQVAAKILKKSPFKITVPKFILKAAGHINDMFGSILGYAPMVSAKKVNELCHANWVVDSPDSLDESDWKAKYSLENGLKETLDWYKDNEYI